VLKVQCHHEERAQGRQSRRDMDWGMGRAGKDPIQDLDVGSTRKTDDHWVPAWTRGRHLRGTSTRCDNGNRGWGEPDLKKSRVSLAYESLLPWRRHNKIPLEGKKSPNSARVLGPWGRAGDY